MKRLFLTIGLVLAALMTMAPTRCNNAEKLRIDPDAWDIQPFYDDSGGLYTYGVTLTGLECKYGLAVAGEHADFAIGVTLSGVRFDDNDWDLDWTETVLVGYQRAPGAVRTADGYIAILTDPVSWNGDDDGSQHLVQEVVISLINPSGNSMGEPVIPEESGVVVSGPGASSPVTFDNNDWDYDPEPSEIVVPLLAAADLVDELSAGYSVYVSVAVRVLDDSGALIGSGSGEGYGDIDGVPIPGTPYVEIAPVRVSSVDWNGDDDGTGIVTGTLTLFAPDGAELGTWEYDDFPVDFGSACIDCEP